MKNMLTKVQKDMAVFDRDGNRIGTVKDIQFGDEDLERPGVETSTGQTPEVEGNQLIRDVVGAIKPDERILPELKARLKRYGYIKVNTGLLSADRYAGADQIASVGENRLDLNAALDELPRA